jgi:hypothetical protein
MAKGMNWRSFSQGTDRSGSTPADMTSEVVEFASVLRQRVGQEYDIASRARNAPPWMKRRIDADRQRRGLRPLWALNDQTRQRASAKAKTLQAFLVAARLRAGLAGS